MMDVSLHKVSQLVAPMMLYIGGEKLMKEGSGALILVMPDLYTLKRHRGLRNCLYPASLWELAVMIIIPRLSNTLFGTVFD
jgi:hypothetical protein